MSALTLAALLQQRAGIEVLLHYSSRRPQRAQHHPIRSVRSARPGGAQCFGFDRDTPQYSTVLEDDASEVDAIRLVNYSSRFGPGPDVGAIPLGVQPHPWWAPA